MGEPYDSGGVRTEMGLPPQSPCCSTAERLVLERSYGEVRSQT